MNPVDNSGEQAARSKKRSSFGQLSAFGYGPEKDKAL
jgi:hypothetical protein